MKIDAQAFSALPYRPEFFRDKNLYGIGHPDLVPVLKRLAKEQGLALPGKSRVIKEHPNLIVQASLLSKDDFPWPRQVLKQFRWRGIQNYLASPLKKSKAIKSYLAACHLLKHGLDTPMPLGAVEVRRCGFVRNNIYISETIREFMDLKKYRKRQSHGREHMEQVIQGLAEYVSRMHDSGLLHRDLHPRNFLIAGESHDFKLFLVDLNRARFEALLSWQLRAMDLARLELKEWQEIFFRYYCGNKYEAEKMLEIAGQTRDRRLLWRKLIDRFDPLRRRVGLK